MPMDLLESDLKRISQSYVVEVLRDLWLTFLIVGFLSTGIALFFFRLLTAYQFTSLRSLAVGCTFGLVAVVYLLTKEAKHFFALRADFKNGTYEQLFVKPKLGIAVDLPSGQPAIALDCDAHTLVLINNWWMNLQRKEIHWEGPGARLNFPSTQFSISRLPISGRVFCVTSVGSRLQVKLEKPMEPELQIDMKNYVDSYVVAQPLNSLHLNRGSLI